MGRGIEISWVANSTTEFDWFEGIGIIEGDELGNWIGSFGLEPEMEFEVAGIEGAAGVHETDEGRI